MCGIVGIVAKTRQGFTEKQKEIFEEMLYVDALRGPDSTGVFSVNFKNHVRVAKQAANPGIFMLTQAWKNWKNNIVFDNQIIVGHNRKATVGSVISKNAHPFDNGKIVLVHNGFIQNAKEFNKEVDVDSEALVTLLDQEKDVLKGLQKLWGAFAIVWYNHSTKRLHLARNDMRPLAIAHTSDHMYFMSEIDMLEWMLKKHGVKPHHIFDMKDNDVFTVSFNPFKIDTGTIPEKVAVRERSYPPQDVNDELGICEIAFEPDWMSGGPMTEADRARETLGKAQRLAENLAAANEAAVPLAVKDMMKLYPPDTKVLFSPFLMVPGQTGVLVKGNVWLPGKKLVEGRINIPHEKDDDVYINPKTPLEAVVVCPATLVDRSYLIVKNLRRPEVTVNTYDGGEITVTEYHEICNNYQCNVCAGQPSRLRPDLTKVSKRGISGYEIVCDKCVLGQHEKPKSAPEQAGENGG